MSEVVALGVAFLAGVLSFLSPCVLPLIPAYLSFMTGLTSAELSGGASRIKVVVPAVLFVLGFSTVFVSMGATASVLGQFLTEYREIIEMVAGAAVIAFGVLMLGIIKVPWLYSEARMDLGRSRSFGRGAAFVMGAAFAAGWTPCVGPILGTILTMAGSSASVASGALLLLAYSMGLGLPFIAVALLFGRMTGLLKWLNRHSLVMNRIAGSLLIVIGLLIVTGQFGAVAAWLTQSIPAIEFDLPTLNE
ncbi:MAG: cytochrome c biogenesis protein CcdA [Coriobacteriia bacterium]|nr:cytochrome c biogenesis protein CcdA [Coriobacteriia bacterium]